MHGSAHFLTRTLNRVSTEMSLYVLAYNLKRVINILGVKLLISGNTGIEPVSTAQNRRTQHLTGTFSDANLQNIFSGPLTAVKNNRPDGFESDRACG